MLGFLVLLVLVHLTTGYENIALSKAAWHQNNYMCWYNYLICKWRAGLAVDGRYSDLSADGGQCTISADKKATAEWRVDLGGVFSIHHIFIQYRTDNVAWGHNNGYTARFLGFSVYVSNTTNKDEGIVCFKDNNYTRDTIPNPVNITCVQHGRYVIYYNNRTRSPLPGGYSTYAFNELCEVGVYGCPNQGYYGKNCTLTCPENCQEGHCDVTDGRCLGCIGGYTGQRCDKKCKDNTYGLECIGVCTNCRNGEPCNHVNGICPNGCDKGTYGFRCDKACHSDHYGYNCQEKCGINCGIPERCDRITGQCEGGCQRGWKGKTCDTKCAGGMFGKNCSEECGFCFQKEQCHFISGICSSGCDSGYLGDQCTKTCSNYTFGPNCSLSCGNCLYTAGEQCNHVTGRCPRDCAEGFQGYLCMEVEGQSAISTKSDAFLLVVIYSLSAVLGVSFLIIIFMAVKMRRSRLIEPGQEKVTQDKINVTRKKKTLDVISDATYGNIAGYHELEAVENIYTYDKLE